MAKPISETSLAVPTAETIADTLNKDLEFKSFAELMSMFEEGEVTHIQTLDDTVVFDKKDLVGKPIIITGFRLGKEGQYNNDFVVVKLVTRTVDINGSVKDLHGIFTDGSTGIKDQLIRFATEQGNTKPIYCPKGLKESSYTYIDPFTKEAAPASTFYLSNES